MKYMTVLFLSFVLSISSGCELGISVKSGPSRPPASLPVPLYPRGDNVDVKHEETDSSFRLLEGYRVHPDEKGDRTA